MTTSAASSTISIRFKMSVTTASNASTCFKVVIMMHPIAAQDPAQHRARIQSGAVIAGGGGNDQGEAARLIEPTHTQMTATIRDGGREAVPPQHGDGVGDELAGAIHDALLVLRASTRLRNEWCA